MSTINAEGIKAAAVKALSGGAELCSDRVGKSGWWHGDRWSIADTLLAWIFGLAQRSGFPLTDYPALADQQARVEARPAFARTVERERAAVTRDDLPQPPGFEV